MRKWLIVPALILFGLASCSDDSSQPADDSTNPEVAILQPAQGATVQAGAVLIRAQATDNEGIEKVEFHVDGIMIGEDASGAAHVYEETWDASGLAAGTPHTLRARAIDTSGNDDDATVTVTICPCPAGPTYHSDNIDTDETWRACCNPHVVTGHLGIENGATLTIQPGCIVRFAPAVDAGLTCGWGPTTGGLVAIGTADSTILFTSNAATPAAGDWFGFGFHSGTFATTRFSYCTIEYAGYAGEQAILLDFGTAVRMDHSTLRFSAGKGIAHVESDAYVAQFSNNTITSCADYPLDTEPEFVREIGTGNHFTGNAAGKDAILLMDGTVETSGTWRDQGVPYRVPDGHNVSIGSQTGSPVVTIEPGTVIQLGLDSYFSVGYTITGGLIAEGTVTEPITFTSAQASPQPGDWRQIFFGDGAVDAQCRLSRCVIEYGGVTGENLWIEDALPTIANCEINHSADWGVTLSGGEHPDAGTIAGGNSFTGNASGNVRVL